MKYVSVKCKSNTDLLLYYLQVHFLAFIEWECYIHQEFNDVSNLIIIFGIWITQYSLKKLKERSFRRFINFKMLLRGFILKKKLFKPPLDCFLVNN